MSKREITGLILTALLVIVIVALIPENPVSRERLNQPSPVSWNHVQDDRNETLSLAWQGVIAYESGREGSWIERNLEAQFNLQLEPIFFGHVGYAKRRPLMLCGGDVPDVMWDGDPLEVRANLRNGFIMEVPYERILERAPTYVHFLNRYGREAWLYTHHNGKNYGLPTFFGGAERPQISAWRMDWLRNVGIERVPETIEEMHEALYRFRHNDPDGNGRQDTYGWRPLIHHWSLIFAEAFAARDVLAFDLMERDGRVVWGGILPEAKEIVRIMRRWYVEGLIDPDFLLNTQGADWDRGFVNGSVGYLYPVDSPVDYETVVPTTMLSRMRTFQPAAEMAPGPPLRNSRGERRGRTWGGAGHILEFGKQLEQRPEAVLRVLDMMESIAANPELYSQARYGRQGEHWAFTEAEGRVQLEPYKSDRRLSNAELLPSSFFFFPSVISDYEAKFVKPEHLRWLDTYSRPEWGMMNVLGKSDVVPSAGRYLGDLRNFQTRVFIEMVVGDRDVDTFDDFVAEWRRRGGDVIEAEANAMYATMQDIWRRVGAAP